ncbi:anhydro-N-acetylmuramic acid kinase [Nitrosomonas sp. Nm166]|uniref:anhydro-N-acetylmuramic acid kinase n=1 Tax=Nitrosomonas sp. Nm166 TaxID=1881054 RepID=UPI0008EA736F|nr:anhydro-N-acetylmuramic acid kinase [Nitrosomonas sp. Nm166]SFE46301.1 anhydro-N-acetylmuramic acid kinase [Nitrosomonas sp. Nm166]
MKSVYYIGIMSGTSLDGVDAVLVDFSASAPVLIQTFFCPYNDQLRTQLLALHRSDYNELHRAAVLSNQLSVLYAEATAELLRNSGIGFQQVVAIGCHGQTIRHCPELEKSYTIQLVNAALLAELTQITVVTDFRSRDIAAGGQGAPLVPAFHHALFKDSLCHRVIVNIGGIANITSLDPHNEIIGFDCGPGNILMDAWCLRHTGKNYDKDGQWAMAGQIIPALLEELLGDCFFSVQPPKSTGRDLFNVEWLEQKLVGSEAPEDVQATLLQLTAVTIIRSIREYCPTATEIYMCGGGAHNTLLMDRLLNLMPERKVALTDQLGVVADWVEAFAFAWLAQRTISRKTGNLTAVTGARGDRILGAIYPA